MLDILEDFVKSQNYSFLRLDGSTPPTKRTQLVDRFNADESTTFVFLLSTKAGGLGLNLVAATVVVIFDPNWNPSHDLQVRRTHTKIKLGGARSLMCAYHPCLQAQDRAYRIGQRHDVNVYRLVSSNTIEENMYLRQVSQAPRKSETKLTGACGLGWTEGPSRQGSRGRNTPAAPL